MDFRASLNLPQPDHTIPMKADLPTAEPVMLASWDAVDLYGLIQASRADAETFVLHDGPAYTNSPIHVGTAMNKCLKDFVVRSRTMMGYRAPYVPGFDNHGLPIEQAVVKEFADKKLQPTPSELRKACRAHAQKYVEVQSEQFHRLGVTGLWSNPYRTMAPRFEAELVRLFKRLTEKGYVYKGLRPTLWSPTSRTALADTEIIYKEHTSTAIYVRFPLLHDHNGFSKELPNFYTIIWTTTPWTIPANLAVAFHPTSEYAVVRVGEDHYILANELLPKVAETLGWTEYEVLYIELGISVEYSKFKHPIFDRESLAVVADYVTMQDGTGVVHTAPGHGRDDFYTGQKYGLPTLTPVDERGVLTAEAGEFAGVFYKNCDTVVVDRLREVGNLLDARPYVHSYPHAERDGMPVIFRATEQWYISLEHDHLRAKMMAEIEHVEWFPKSGHARISAMVAGRPDWCVSRQRPWGVGIPIFYGVPSGEPVMDPVAMEAVANLVEKAGSEAWFETKPQDILPSGYKHPKTGETEFRKETDVLDVWFDSGATSIAVLEGMVEPAWKEHWPADLYLEGSDQHRGWFNSSLILGTAIHGRPPYRQVLTHGFVTDENGLKQSKRLGNVVDPKAAAETVGADVVRYWAASVDYVNDVPCSENLLKRFGEQYRNVRNALRFLLSNLYDYQPSDAPPTLLPIDEWAVEQADLLVSECVAAYTRYDFGAVITGIHNFCRSELSSFYLDVIKDRLYCDGAAWESRRSGQAACQAVLIRLVKLVAPILPFTAEETWQRLHGRLAEGPLSPEEVKRSVHLAYFDAPNEERMAAIEGSPLQIQFAALLSARAEIFTAFETWKASASVKDSQDVVVTYQAEGSELKSLRTFSAEDLATFLKVSAVTLIEGNGPVEFAMSPFLKCERSRIRRASVVEEDGLTLSERDRKAWLEVAASVGADAR